MFESNRYLLPFSCHTEPWWFLFSRGFPAVACQPVGLVWVLLKTVVSLSLLATVKSVMFVLGLGCKAKFCALGLAIGWSWPLP